MLLAGPELPYTHDACLAAEVSLVDEECNPFDGNEYLSTFKETGYPNSKNINNFEIFRRQTNSCSNTHTSVMSSDIPFSMDSLSDSLPIGLRSESDYEPTVGDFTNPRYYKRCHWSGKAFFDYMMEDVVFRTSPASWAGDELDVRL